MNEMNQVDNNKLTATKAILVGLLAECPFGDGSNFCPLYERKETTFFTMLEWVHSLTIDELQQFILTHHECSSAKRAGRKPETDPWF